MSINLLEKHMKIIFLVLLIMTNPFRVNATTLRAIISQSNTPPYIMITSNQEYSGLVIDTLEELGRRLEAEVKHFPIPRARVESWLNNGEADIWCFLNPAWVTKAENFDWSVSLYQTTEVLVSRQNETPFTSMATLYKKRIGTTRGFVYPQLEAAFAANQLYRDDAISLQQNLERLQQGRLDAVIADSITYQYYALKHQPLLTASTFWSTPVDNYCAISKTNPEMAKQINNSLRQMQQDNFFKQRIELYLSH